MTPKKINTSLKCENENPVVAIENTSTEKDQKTQSAYYTNQIKITNASLVAQPH